MELEFPRVFTDTFNFTSQLGDVRLKGSVAFLKDSIDTKVGFVWADNLEKVQNDSLVEKTYVPFNQNSLKFETLISGLSIEKIYFFKAFAEFTYNDISGTRITYGEIIPITSMVTILVLPELITINNMVQLEGRVEGLGNEIEVMEHGYVYSELIETPTIDDGNSQIINLGVLENEGNLKDTLIGNLAFNTQYFYRAWLKSQATTYYSSNTGTFKVHDGWEVINSFPFPFQEGVAVSDDNIAYVIGGCQSFDDCQTGSNNTFVYAYDYISNTWNDQGITPLAVQRHNSIGFVLNHEIYFGFGESRNLAPQPLKSLYKLDIEGKVWNSVPAFSNPLVVARSRAVAFCIDGKAYFGTGWGKDSLLNDFWEFDPILDTCRKMEDLPIRLSKVDEKRGRRDAIAFSLRGHGYVMCGITVGYLDLNDVWEFIPPDGDNPGGNWKFVEHFPGPRRAKGIAFTFEDKAFVGLGYNVADGVQELNDLWEFIPDPEMGSSHFESRVSFVGVKRENAVAFVVGNKAYVGSGQFDLLPLQDFWKYTPKTD